MARGNYKLSGRAKLLIEADKKAWAKDQDGAVLDRASEKIANKKGLTSIEDLEGLKKVSFFFSLAFLFSSHKVMLGYQELLLQQHQTYSCNEQGSS